MLIPETIALPFIISLSAGLISGVIIFLVGLRWRLLTSYLSRDRAAFRRVFGAKAAEAGILTITLDTYRDIRLFPTHIQEEVGTTPTQASATQERRFYKVFPDGHVTGFPEAYGDVLGYCSARAAAYLVDSLRAIGIMGRIASDRDVSSQWDGSLVNIGSSASNIKTNDIKYLPEKDNPWLVDDLESFTFRDGRKVKIEDGTDKGIILKLNNPYFRGYTVLVCAGLGEWGTSGAAWFLSSKWRMLGRRFGSNRFLVVVGVTPGADESAREMFAEGKESILWRLRSLLRLKKKNRSAGPKSPRDSHTREWNLE